MKRPSLSRESKSTKTHPKQCASAIGQHLLENSECAANYKDDSFRILGMARSRFHLATLEAVFIKAIQP